MVRKQRPKEPSVPAERHETIRKEILSLLLDRTLSSKDVSAEVHISEKDVYEHLEHIRRSAHKTGHQLTLIPAECSKCGFVFIKRERLKKPGRCPICHGEKIQEPAYTLKATENDPR